MKAAVVLTTINVPTLLGSYVENFERFGSSDIGFIVIGDRRTPNDKCEKVAKSIKDKGFEACYFDVASQKRFLKDFPELAKVVPYNTDNRRNIGFIIAAQYGVQTLISIDDDNYASDVDFFRYHSLVGKEATLPTVTSTSGWFNPCIMLETDHGGLIYPRGYPFSKRRKERYTFTQTTGKIAMNMGLWTSDPDADAVTHLANPTKMVRMKENFESIMLSPNTYSPINTQNTAFHRDVLPCYYYILMNANLKGLKIDRYGDIWSGFFVKKAIDQMDERVVIGQPMVDHRRNSHNYLKDLRYELWGMTLTEDIVNWLEQLQLESNNYFDIYLEMATGIDKLKENFQEYAIRKYLEKIAYAMTVWVGACHTILDGK